MICGHGWACIVDHARDTYLDAPLVGEMDTEPSLVPEPELAPRSGRQIHCDHHRLLSIDLRDGILKQEDLDRNSLPDERQKIRAVGVESKEVW